MGKVKKRSNASSQKRFIIFIGLLFCTIAISRAFYVHWHNVHCEEGDAISRFFSNPVEEALEAHRFTERAGEVLPVRPSLVQVAGPTLILTFKDNDAYMQLHNSVVRSDGVGDKLRELWKSVVQELKRGDEEDHIHVIKIQGELGSMFAISDRRCE